MAGQHPVIPCALCARLVDTGSREARSVQMQLDPLAGSTQWVCNETCEKQLEYFAGDSSGAYQRGYWAGKEDEAFDHMQYDP